ncbi:hypothetical protein SAY87_026897 [Trapa incisa]|uniref:Uncharacterized protein n=1 Tax=Trapa incisa TaxID=236973 RepID=A0AAN7GYI2_9MYRT|nr:hypothetical protein SAY87_026897 [Trapa incisa]
MRVSWVPLATKLPIFLLLVVLGARSDPGDELCLTRLAESLQDPAGRLENWTKSTFASPCSGFTSYLNGATCNNGRIYKLSLSNLSLRGSISPFLANCTNLQALDLSSNALTGAIPPDLQSLVNLAVLNLSANRLSSEIPPQLALCAYLNVIDLHDNQLSGQIPQQLGLLVRLSAFDVSRNRLSGPIPSSLGNRSGNLPRFNATSFEGNKNLYGYPLPQMKGNGLSILAIVGIGLGSGLASLVLSFTGVCIWLKITDRKMALEESKGAISAGHGYRENGHRYFHKSSNTMFKPSSLQARPSRKDPYLIWPTNQSPDAGFPPPDLIDIVTICHRISSDHVEKASGFDAPIYRQRRLSLRRIITVQVTVIPVDICRLRLAGRLGSPRTVVSKIEGDFSCTAEVQRAIPVLKKAYGDRMHKVLHVGPETCSVVSKLLAEEETEAWGAEPYDLEDADGHCKALIRKGVVRVADVKFPLPYRPKSFDLVLVSDALDYLSPRYLNKTLPDLARVSGYGVVIFAGNPGRQRAKVAELSKFGKPLDTAAEYQSPAPFHFSTIVSVLLAMTDVPAKFD